MLSCVQVLLIMCVDFRLPKHISAHIKREEAAKKGNALAPIYTESTIMSPVKRDDPEESDSRVDIQNPLFKDAHQTGLDAPGIAAAQHDSAVASFADGSTLEGPDGIPPPPPLTTRTVPPLTQPSFILFQVLPLVDILPATPLPGASISNTTASTCRTKYCFLDSV